MLKHQHRTLARTLAFIGLHSPGDYGLFWNPDGTMPWKEFYWALQEDPELRFVREATLRELSLVGADLPFTLDGNCLRLLPGIPVPHYEPADNLPERLVFGIRPKNLVRVQDSGLSAASRPFLALSSDREMALRISKRRESEPIIIEILAHRARESGIAFLSAGPQLYLAERVPREFLIVPLIRIEVMERLIEKRPKPEPKKALPTPGSFAVQPHHLPSTGTSSEKQSKRGSRKPKGGWKEGSRKERNKRKV